MTYLGRNLKTLASTVPEIWRKVQIVKMGGGVIGVTEGHHKRHHSSFDRGHMTFCSPFMEIMWLSCTVFRDVASYLSNVANFHTAGIFGSQVGVTPLEFRQDLWYQKTRAPIMCCCMTLFGVILLLAVLIELWLVTDRQIDKQTDR